MGGHYDKDIMKQLQEVMERLDKTEQEVKDTKKEWKKEVKELKAETKRLKAENKALRAKLEEKDKRITTLENENSRLRSQLNNDSTNSSLPPSTDQKGKKANQYNSRVKSSKHCGGQDGHKGVTLSVERVKEKINEGKLKHEIIDVGDPTKKYVTRYKIDYRIIPTAIEIRFHADENGKINIPKDCKAPVGYGNTIKAMAVYLYSEGVVSNDKICSFVNTLGDNVIELSTGEVYTTTKKFSKKCTPEIEQITEELLSSEVMYTDATVVSVNGQQKYIRNTSTDKAVLYSAMSKKNIESIREKSILGRYTGTLVHDHETAMYNFGTEHGECNVHLLRYLKKNTEESGNKWSGQMAKLLTEMNEARKEKISNKSWFNGSEIEAYEKEYDKIINKGYKENEKTKSKYAKDEEATLLKRLKKYKPNHLLFIHDNRVGFDNNMSERDLRKCKNRQKMAGGFRTDAGQEMYCIILSVIETCKRKGGKIFEKIIEILGRPVMA